jgi:cardiolipin synthase
MSPVSAGNYKIFDDPLQYYNAMLRDISRAKKYIYLETYKYNNDSMGERFRSALTKKCKEGVEVKILIDAWGAAVSYSYFSELVKYGGEVRFFTKIKFFIDFFTKNHRRNHRKFLIIDDAITFIGSANINDYSLAWREMMLRVKGDLALSFKKVFNLDFKIFNKYIFEKNAYLKVLKHGNFEIIRDVPSIAKKRISKKFIYLIRRAQKDVVIETPYFLPGFFLRKALMDAGKRGVDVKVILPKHSDVLLVDILRNKYVGLLHMNQVQFLYYLPNNLHAKVMLIDDSVFAIGSPNFDYRSFRYMHEIVLIGNQPEIVNQLKEHINVTIQNSQPFDYQTWLKRPMIQRFFEWLLLPFRHLL